MKNIRKKAITGTLLLIMLVILFGGIMFFINMSFNMNRDMEDDLLNMKSIVQSMDRVDLLSSEMAKSLIEYRTTKTKMAAITLRGLPDQSQEVELRFLMDGCTVKATEDGIEVPEGFPEEVPISGVTITDESGCGEVSDSSDDGYYLISYSRINGPYYFIEWEPYQEFFDELNTYMDSMSLIRGLERAFNAKIMVVDKNPGEENTMVFYASEELPQHMLLEEYGITDAQVEGAVSAFNRQWRHEPETSEDAETVQRKATAEAAASGQKIKIREKEYEVYGAWMEQMNATMLILFPTDDSLLLAIEQSMILVVLVIAIGIVFITWMISVLILVRDHTLDEQQRTIFDPGSFRKRSWMFVLCGLVFMGAIGALSRSMFSMYRQANRVEHSLALIEEKIDENEYQVRTGRESMKKMYLQYARHIRDMFTEDPGLCNPESMQEICDMTGAAYLMLFDENGNETISNSGLINLSLGEGEDSPTADFRRLLNGVKEIVHDPAHDEETGLDAALIGVSIPIDGKKPGYGALLMAVPTEEIISVAEQDPSDLMKLLAAEGSVCFSIDPESGRILDASDLELIGQEAAVLGLPESALHDSFMDYFKLNGTYYYGESSEKDGILYYFGIERQKMYGEILIYILLSMIGYLIVMIPVNLFMGYGYTKDYAVYADKGDALSEEDEDLNVVSVAGGRVKRSVDPSRRWLRFESNRHAGMPFRNALMMARLLFVIYMVLITLLVGSRRVGQSTENSVLGYLLRGSWSEGLNIFAFANIFILGCVTAMGVILAGGLLRVLSSILGTRGETVCRLLLNVVRYVSVIIFVYFALAYLGINTTALLASLGLLSFAVSLGAKDLITDILAGISIVFEGEYQVGDIIEVNGYRGMVLEIGVRTTKLEGRGGNIKIIANRDVKNVLNMTRKHSWYPVELNVVCNSEHPIEVIEQMLREELAGIGERIPEIISGPFYKGVIGFGNGFVTLSIIAECNEADYHLVQRELNRALQLILEEHDIQLK